MKKKSFLLFFFLLLTTPLFATTSEQIGQIATTFVNNAIQAIGTTFDQIYLAFDKQFNLSFENLNEGFLPTFLYWLIFFELLWVCLQGILQKELGVPELFMKLFLTVLIIILCQNMAYIVYGIRSVFSYAGVTAGDLSPSTYSNVSISGFFGLDSTKVILRPSIVSNATIEIFTPISRVINTIKAYIDSMQIGFLGIGFGSDVSLPTYIARVVPGWLAIAACYIVEFILLIILSFVNMNVMLTLIEFGFLMVVATICLPFQIFTPTKFVAHGLWQTLFGQCVKIFCILFLVGIAKPLYEDLSDTLFSPVYNYLESVARTSSGGIDTEEFVFPAAIIVRCLLTSVCMTVCYCYMLMKGPSIAFAILSGTPTMETLGTHTVTRLGSRAIGASVGVFAAGFGALGGIAGTILGGIGGSIGNIGHKIGDVFKTARERIGSGGGNSANSDFNDSSSGRHKFNSSKFDHHNNSQDI